jgi:hypothetical protein
MNSRATEAVPTATVAVRHQSDRHERAIPSRRHRRIGTATVLWNPGRETAASPLCARQSPSATKCLAHRTRPAVDGRRPNVAALPLDRWSASTTASAEATAEAVVSSGASSSGEAAVVLWRRWLRLRRSAGESMAIPARLAVAIVTKPASRIWSSGWAATRPSLCELAFRSTLSEELRLICWPYHKACVT